jgi:hypothetical protein
MISPRPRLQHRPRACASAAESPLLADEVADLLSKNGQRVPTLRRRKSNTRTSGIASGCCSAVIAGETGMGPGEGPRRDAHDLAYQGRNHPLTSGGSLRSRASVACPLEAVREPRVRADHEEQAGPSFGISS